MGDIHSPSGQLPKIPDDISIPQFIFDYSGATRPTRAAGIPWLIEDSTGRKIGLEELRQRTKGLANSLYNTYNIREDDVVLLFSRNHVDYPVAIWAVHRLGGVISGANPDFSQDELLYQLETCKATFVIAHPDSLEVALRAAQLGGIPPERVIVFNAVSSGISSPGPVTVNDLVRDGLLMKATFVEPKISARTKLAFLSFSSGTTGKPKAVAIPHIALITNVIQMAVHSRVNEEYTTWENRRYRPGDVAIGVLPFYHAYGLVINLHFILYCGISLVVVPKFNFIEMLRSIVRHQITHLMLVPPQAILLCKHSEVKNYDLSCIRFIMIGAAPLSDEVNRQLFQLFPHAHIGQAHGMTETFCTTAVWPITQKRGTSGSAGQLITGMIARVVKEDGSLARFNEPGELVLWTPAAALGYINNEQATKETFNNGWIRTGDEVKINANAEMWIIDRLKEIMKVRGFQVAPAELEGCILDHEDVSDVCVVGVPDDYSGEVPLAFVVLSADATRRVTQHLESAEEIKSSIMKHVATKKIHYKHLKGGVEFVEGIPRNPSGKLLRRVLRDRAKELRKLKTRL